jgi:hypothetical protein
MKRKIYFKFIITFCLFLGTTLCSAQNKLALLVGISDYESNPNTGWENINGANDIKLLVSDLEKKGFNQIVAISDQEATCENIKNNLKMLISSSQKGDIVYFHFSGHGQPVLDLNGDEGIEDGWDESIIPYDANMYYQKNIYEGEKHITDDLLNEFLICLRKKVGPTGLVYVVIDACFSGSAVRSFLENDSSTFLKEEIDLDAPIRGQGAEFKFGTEKNFTPKPDIRIYHKIKSEIDLANIVSIEACAHYQKCREIKVNNSYYGPLSYYIHESLQHNDITHNTIWITDAVKLHRLDRRLFKQKVVCESTFDYIPGF